MEATLTNIPLPVFLRPSQPMSDEEFMVFSGRNEAFRMEREANGDLLIMSPSGLDTAHQNSRISRWLEAWAEEDGRGRSFDSNAGYTMRDGSIRSPDASWLSDRKYRALPLGESARFARVCPEFVIELRSPSDSLFGLQRKMHEWVANGAELGWLIDPSERAVTIYRPNCEPERLDNISQVAGEGPVAGFVLPLDRIFN